MPQYRNIVIEGPDFVGKTTLGKALLDKLSRPEFAIPWMYRHSGGSSDYPKVLLERMIAQMERTYAIFDRHSAISEQVYGRVIRHGPLFPRDVGFYFLEELNPLVVYCIGRVTQTELKELSVKSHKPKQFVRSVIENYSEIATEYREVMNHLTTYGTTVLMVDPKTLGLDYTVDYVLKTLAPKKRAD